MRECPRCQTTLERLSLGEATTVACNRCGFADVPVKHHAEWQESETWQDAFNRFYDR